MWLTSGSALNVMAAAFVTARHVAAELNVHRGEKKKCPCYSALEGVEVRQAELQTLNTAEQLLASGQETKKVTHILLCSTLCCISVQYFSTDRLVPGTFAATFLHSFSLPLKGAVNLLWLFLLNQ